MNLKLIGISALSITFIVCGVAWYLDSIKSSTVFYTDGTYIVSSGKSKYYFIYFDDLRESEIIFRDGENLMKIGSLERSYFTKHEYTIEKLESGATVFTREFDDGGLWIFYLQKDKRLSAEIYFHEVPSGFEITKNNASIDSVFSLDLFNQFMGSKPVRTTRYIAHP